MDKLELQIWYPYSTMWSSLSDWTKLTRKDLRTTSQIFKMITNEFRIY